MMNLELPDYARSRAILVGTSEYGDESFGPLPAAANSLKGLSEILVDDRLCGWPAERVTALLNPGNGSQLVMSLREWAQDTEEVLLLYYVGHGTISPAGELCLTLPNTEFNHPDVTGIEYRHIRSALLDSPARIKVVILDCCFSGRAIEALCSEKDIADVADIRGAYTITASDQAAHVPPLSEQAHKCTSFTGEFLDLIRTGIPDGPEMLTLSMIYSHLRTRLQGRQLPAPNQRGIDTAGEFAFTRNGALLQTPIQETFPHRKAPAPADRSAWHKRIIAAAAMTTLAASGAYLLGRAEDQAAAASLSCGAARPAAAADRPVVVGSANFPESDLLGQIYADALRGRGIAVTTKLEAGPREVYYPQVCAGQITIVPEYNGALLTTSVDDGSGAVTTGQVDAALKAHLPRSLEILDPSSAQDKDSVTVTQATAAKYHLKSIVDLRRLPRLPRLPVIGGSEQFFSREQGYAGLRSQYGLTSLAFLPLDNSGPKTIQALTSGVVQAADVFTTSAMIKADHLVSLADPRNVFRAENIVPLVYKPDVNPAMIAALNAVSARLTLADLLNMDVKITLHPDSIPVVAQDWLTQVGLR
jgi:glycine betaine/choline ABC-type transport system substrate-binding protein